MLLAALGLISTFLLAFRLLFSGPKQVFSSKPVSRSTEARPDMANVTLDLEDPSPPEPFIGLCGDSLNDDSYWLDFGVGSEISVLGFPFRAENICCGGSRRWRSTSSGWAATGGVWVLHCTRAKAARKGASRNHIAATMEERCQVIEKLGGVFYANPRDCLHLDLP
ncbi:uncharacterized protein BO97DRAFT_427554 [Aspergillus homomorphus CBS 101889]|uniref:Peptidase M15A C-terminal domain-containing protein n=1 Tax=Aspergillus homomorphus (strain CBS 101889) TaxID=1450537 RepID=A0A395HST1_ASPHC|nr:hypothetical protein BO97DRAFT_427554 [Aspergillus homomorphus CBS 101889]RAL09284.1 hypothetical protein BO97DRAFT_427554 [Aspergillus homomorphus CBS 101889]